MEEELRLQEERLRVALQAVPVVVSNQDKDLRYTWIHDPCSRFRTDQVLGRTDAEVFPAEDTAAMTAVKQQVLASGKGARREFRRNEGAKTCIYNLTVEPLYDTAGSIAGITCAWIDISSLRCQDKGGKDAG